MKHHYHSALKKEVEGLPSLAFHTSNGNMVFQHDISKGVPLDYDQCDVIYTEPAWRDGYELFLDRAGAENTSYLEYVVRMADFIGHTRTPIYMIVGKHVIKEFPKPVNIAPIKLHGYTTYLCVWNDKQQVNGITNYDVIKQLSGIYDIVGDFNAGYGNTAKIFQDAGKKFICSDINGKCVYYIAKNLMGYE